MDINLPFTALKDCEILRDFPLSSCTGFRCGGPAAAAIFPHSVSALCSAVAQLKDAKIDFYILGNGSNVLAPEQGLFAPVIFTRCLNGIRVEDGCVEAECGAMLSAVCTAAAEASLSGLEFAYGIPGSVGGAVYMNAGAYGGEISDCIKWARVLLEDGSVQTLTGEQLQLSYRSSALQQSGGVVLSAAFSLKEGDSAYIKLNMREILDRRIAKQPLNLPSCGSAFKRPQGEYAAALIERCGLKGCTVGGAQVSEKHSGFIVNTGGASSLDVKSLVAHVRETVFQRTGIMLEPEIRLMGEQWT